MRCLLSVAVLTLLLLANSCKEDDQYEACQTADTKSIIGSWGEPMFMSNYDSCTESRCIGIRFDINADLGYSLNYAITDEASGDTLVRVEDEGSYVLDCEDSGFLSGRYSSVKFMEGALMLNSDFFPAKSISVRVSGVLGLILDPNDLNFRDSVGNPIVLSRL